MQLVTSHQINRGIEKRLRSEAVRRNLWVDPELYIGDNTGYRAAIDAIDNKQQTPILSGGAGTSRGELDTNRIVLQRTGLRRGQVTLAAHHTGAFRYRYETTDKTYEEAVVPNGTRDLVYEVRTLALNNAMDVTLEGVVMQALATPAYVRAVDSNGQELTYGYNMYQEGEARLIDYERYFERLYSFVVRDVWLGEHVTPVAVHTITEIRVVYQGPVDDPQDAGQTNINFNA